MKQGILGNIQNTPGPGEYNYKIPESSISYSIRQKTNDLSMLLSSWEWIGSNQSSGT